MSQKTRLEGYIEHILYAYSSVQDVVENYSWQGEQLGERQKSFAITMLQVARDKTEKAMDLAEMSAIPPLIHEAEGLYREIDDTIHTLQGIEIGSWLRGSRKKLPPYLESVFIAYVYDKFNFSEEVSVPRFETMG